jgi:hypothetical protein
VDQLGKGSGAAQVKRERGGVEMNRGVCGLVAAAILAVGLGAAADAQSLPRNQAPPPPPLGFGGGDAVFIANPAEGVFSFVEPGADFGGKVVQNAPFSAEVTRETVHTLSDGNRIDQKSTGTIARDSTGRTRREMFLPNIGPLAASGQPPHLAFINDPAAGKVYTLDFNKKTASVMTPPPAPNRPPRQFSESKSGGPFKGETTTESLGQKSIDGVPVQGTRTTLTIPAGQIGNEKPIVITTERWYSPDLQTTVLLTRSDPRFGTTTYQLSGISRAEPPGSLFAVPSDFSITPAGHFRTFHRPNVPPPNQ